MTPARLGVNIDHVATLRNARGGPHPDPLAAARLAIAAGADGITIHLREDRRHIRDADLAAIRTVRSTSRWRARRRCAGSPSAPAPMPPAWCRSGERR